MKKRRERRERRAAVLAARKAEKHAERRSARLARALPRCEGCDATGDVCRPRLRPKRRRSTLPLMLAAAGLGAAYAPPPMRERGWSR